MESPIQQATRFVSDALALDGNHNSKEAYIRYLQCLQLIIHSLLQDASHQAILAAGTPQKLIKLGQQCFDRIENLVYEVHNADDNIDYVTRSVPSPLSPLSPSRTFPVVNVNSQLSSVTPVTSSMTSTLTSMTSTLTPTATSLPAFQPIGSEDDTDAGVKRRPRNLTPMEMARRQNEQLMVAYKARLARIQKKNPSYTNINLTLHRKLAENMAIAKAREEALAKKMKERQKRLEQQAASRFVSTPGMSRDEQERRLLYTKILEYEQDTKWPLSWRERLKANPNDPRLMQDLIKSILSYGDHPLTQMIAGLQTTIYKKLEPLCAQYIGDLEHIKVPYYLRDEESKDESKTFQNECSFHKETSIDNQSNKAEDQQVASHSSFDHQVAETLDNSESISKENAGDNFTEIFEESKLEVEKALEANEKLVRGLTLEDEEAVELAADGNCLARLSPEDENKMIEMKVKLLKQEALERHLQHIIKDIHEALDRVLTMFVVSYEMLDSPVGRDVTYSNIEEPFFKSIWPFLLSLFRFVNRQAEEKIALVITDGLKLSPQDIGVKTKFLPPMNTPSQHEYPFSPAVAELCKMTTLPCPLSKLECIVRMVRTICQCVLEYDDSLPADGLPNLGADDLLPILMFVIVRSSLPQLVSECHVMEEFIHEGYLMGEEGYCLTSLQTALCYMGRLEPQQTLAHLSGQH